MDTLQNQFCRQLNNLSKADLHIHSNFSDGAESIDEILEYVQEQTDLAVIAITDHDTIKGALLAKKIMKNKLIACKIMSTIDFTPSNQN